MANPDAPFGLKPVRYLGGAPYNGQAMKCKVASAYATALFVGDPVDLDTTLTSKDDNAVYPTVIKATAGDGYQIWGVIVAIEPNPTDLSKQYIPASTGGYVYVCTDPQIVYHIRDDGAATPTDVQAGQNGVLIFTHSGNTSTGISKVELDMNSDPPAADASNQLFILGLANIPGNTLGTHAIWEVLINQIRTSPNAGLGVTST